MGPKKVCVDMQAGPALVPRNPVFAPTGMRMARGDGRCRGSFYYYFIYLCIIIFFIIDPSPDYGTMKPEKVQF